jgi:hypothetical protein
MIPRLMVAVVFLFYSLLTTLCYAENVWEFNRTYESKSLFSGPFYLFTSADLNKNGIKELIVTDFGDSGNHIEEWKQWKHDHDAFSLIILEWEKGELKTRFQKRWDMSKAKTNSEKDRYFRANKSAQMVFWQVGERAVVETIPPYLGIEWQDGKYMLHEQQGWAQESPLVGSWVFPWLNPSCYGNFPNKLTWPRECLVGIRDLRKDQHPKIVSIVEEELIKNQKYKQTLRVRQFEDGFPIEWEQPSPKRFGWWGDWSIVDPIDRLNKSATSPLMMTAFQEPCWYLLAQESQGKGYRVIDAHIKGPRGIINFDLPDIYLRKTKNQRTEEYWGYHKIDLNDPRSINFILMLRKVTLRSDLSGFDKEDIDFPHHEHFLGVGYFDVQDIDGDGLDEIILVEETAAKLNFGEESVQFEDVKDYIHILKWDGKKYQTVWVSLPFTQRGTKFLVEDIKNTGKKQLVVLTPYGTVQIWEKQ